MATLERETILGMIDNGQPLLLKGILRELLESNEKLLTETFEEYFRDRRNLEHRWEVNKVKCSIKDAAWIHRNITEKEILDFVNRIECSKMFDVGDLQTLAIKCFKTFDNLQSFGRMQNVVAIIYKALGGKDRSKKIYKERVRYIGFREEEKFENAFKLIKDCREAAEIYENRRSLNHKDTKA